MLSSTVFGSYLTLRSDDLFQAQRLQASVPRQILLAFPMLTELCDLKGNAGRALASECLPSCAIK